jgi:hypothetical protein
VAGAAGKGVLPHRARAQIACPQSVVILRGRGYGLCGGSFWIRNPETGQVKAVPFWRLQHQNDRTDDRQ